MKDKKLSILFVIKLSKQNKKQLCPINFRITYKKKRKELSTGLFVNPAHWNAKKQIVVEKALDSDTLNGQLSLIRQKLNNAYLSLQVQNIEFDVDDILDKYLNKKIRKEDDVVNYFKRFLATKHQLVGKDIKISTWKKSEYVCADVAAFVQFKFKQKDYPLNKLSLQFLVDFEHYLKTVKNQKQITINKSLQRFRKPIRVAVAEGYLQKDPFAFHKPGRVRKEVIFLSTEELNKLEEFNFTQPRLQLVKDLFIFCCYTGLAYHEMANLKKEHIAKGFDGNEWIQMKREKTGKLVSVPLLSKAKQILAVYNSSSDYLLPKMSNQKINSYLKEIAEILGIKKRITHHTARKTFASTVLLYNNVPLEVVSELLGHSSIRITQESYGKVVQKKISLEMNRIASLFEE